MNKVAKVDGSCKSFPSVSTQSQKEFPLVHPPEKRRAVKCSFCGAPLGEVTEYQWKKFAGKEYLTPALKELYRPHAKDPLTFSKCLSLLMQDLPVEVAGNPNTPHDTLEVLSRHTKLVQKALLKNPVLPMLAIEMTPWVLSFTGVNLKEWNILLETIATNGGAR